MLLRVLQTMTTISEARRDRGAVAGEYAVLLGLITVALITIIGTFTGAVTNAFQAAIDILP